MPVKCNTCNGVYETTTRDGSQYFHACAPLSRLVVENPDRTRAVIDVGTLDLRPVVETIAVDRPEMRDENIRQLPGDRRTSIRAEGKGTTPVVDARPLEGK